MPMPMQQMTEFVSPIPRIMRLPVDEYSVVEARRFVEREAARWQLSNVDEIALVTTELVENALQHATDSIEVAIGRRADCVVVQVLDDDKTLPEPYPVEALADRGRGLVVVDALADKWGTTPLDHGKRVWAEVAIPE